MNIFGLLQTTAQRRGGDGAVFNGTALQATYAQLHDRALRIGEALRSRLKSGAHVLVASGNCPEYIEIMFGIWAAGMVAVPLNAKLHAREMQEIAGDAGVDLVLASAKLAPSFVTTAPTIAIGSAEYDALLGAAPTPATEVRPDALAWLFFTSGTTGRSKGAMLSHRNLHAMAMTHLVDLDPGEGGSIIHAAPLSHGSGLYVLPYTLRGARHVIPTSGGFEADEFLALSSAHPGCAAFLAPTMIRRLRVLAEETGERGALRTIVSGGGPMYLDELKRAMAVFGPIISQMYGQGETPMTITALRPSDHVGAVDDRLSSVGWPRPGVEVRVVDAQDQPVAAGEIGEVICRGGTVMRGYWNNDAATAATLRDGWLWTGDMGSFDQHGCLTLRDRSKDVIISGGTNIYPREVEEVLTAHPAIAEAAVIGAPDPEWGENVVAVVVREPGCDVDDAELDRHCVEQIARFKRPKRYIFVDALPKSHYGKVLKRELFELVMTP